MTTKEELGAAAVALHMTPAAPPTQRPAVLIQPTEDNRLMRLAAQWDTAYAEAKEADKRLTEIKNAIKIELTMSAPGADDIRLLTPDLAKPLRLHPVTSMRVDSTKLRENYPEVYEACTAPSTQWRLEAVRG